MSLKKCNPGSHYACVLCALSQSPSNTYVLAGPDLVQYVARVHLIIPFFFLYFEFIPTKVISFTRNKRGYPLVTIVSGNRLMKSYASEFLVYCE